MEGAASSRLSTKILAEAAVVIALSSVLHLVRPINLPQGGSVTLGSMIPIFWFALRRGAKLGLVAGTAFGLVVLYEEPFIFHPVQVLLDYPIAFAALGLAGFFRKIPLLGVGVGILGRFLAHFTSGIIFFAEYAPEGMNPALYSAIYNGSYLGVEFIVSAVVMLLLLQAKALEAYL